ncbi:MAG: PilZ domain-containing protein [Deltaproteobacteria bacterium]|nr:PilZ domain-containing protein [Deltaproteobacteria bacterium]
MARATTPQTTESISAITAKLFGLILRMPVEERRSLLSELEAKAGAKKRQETREDYFMVVQYAVGDKLSSGYIKNISSGGIFVETPSDILKEVTCGNRITLTFSHPTTKKNVKINGEIVRIEDSGIGINFDGKIPLAEE